MLGLSKLKRDPNWNDRLTEEYTVLIDYVEKVKKEDSDWFNIESDETGMKWFGKCWIIYEQIKYEFRLEFEIPPTYPITPIELVLPELDGKTEKMYRGGKICQDIHFAPHWVKNFPKFGITHSLVYGVIQLVISLVGSRNTQSNLTGQNKQKVINFIIINIF